MLEIPKNAMVLAAGLGRRMRPLTDRLPKPLVEVSGRPLIDYALELLEQAGVARAVVNASYLAEKLAAYLAARRSGIRVTLSREETPLETGGGIARALPLLGHAPFYAINSDVILRNGAGMPALRQLAEAWDDGGTDALLLLVPKTLAVGYGGAGDFFLEDGRLRRREGASSAPYVFTGTQLLHPRLFEDCPQGAFSINLLYDRRKDAEGFLPRIGAIVHDGAWLHVGTPEAVAAAEAALTGITRCDLPR